MNNILNKAAFTESLSEAEADKYITFKLADYLFALPGEAILKIVATPAPSQGGMVSMGLVQLEQYSIQTIDLAKLLSLKKHAEDHPSATPVTPERTDSKTLATIPAEKNPPFLMVLQDAEDTLWGIAVEEPPDLMDIPHYALKPVPSEKRMTRALRWVSHVVTYDLSGDRHTLLLLDLSALLAQEPINAVTPSDENFLGIEPPLEVDNIEIESPSVRKEEMYA